jgi:hypothetical protein
MYHEFCNFFDKGVFPEVDEESYEEIVLFYLLNNKHLISFDDFNSILTSVYTDVTLDPELMHKYLTICKPFKKDVYLLYFFGNENSLYNVPRLKDQDLQEILVELQNS